MDPALLRAAIAEQAAALSQSLAESLAESPAAVEPDALLAVLLELVLLAAEDHLVVPIARRRAVRAAAAVVAARAPGRSVELRVPPDAAVQCVPGPRHTRGTPPAVVETDPITFLQLAGGHRTWSQAVGLGLVRASGQRTDLSEWLPVVELPGSPRPDPAARG